MAGMPTFWVVVLIVVAVAHMLLLDVVPRYLDRLAKKWADEEKQDSDSKGP
jgi:hypothetical protein